MSYLFKKKNEVVDFRPKDADMPIPTKMRERLLAGKPDSSTLSLNSSATTTPNSSTSSGSGFFSFFGGSSDSSTSSSPVSSSSVSNSSSGSFWDAGTNTSSSSSLNSNSNSSFDKLESSLNDLLYRFSRLVDRVELLEKKMDRVERKDGSSSGGY